MRVMYWNCTTPALGDTTFNEKKIAMISARILAIKPDIVCLDEVSEKLNNQAQAQNYADAYTTPPAATAFGAYYKAIAVNANPGTHLNQAVYLANGAAKCAGDVGIPNADWGGDKTKRNLTRVTWQDAKASGRMIYIWFLHANASESGGKLAVDLALTAMKGTSAVFIGDFNNSGLRAIETAKGYSKSFAVLPITRSVADVAYTQWSRAETGPQSVAAYKIIGTTNDFKPSPSGCLDFALGSGLIKVAPVDALVGLDDAAVGQLMMNMDHFPIAYDITPFDG